MPTGIEAAGLALAVFPLVVEGIKFYLKGLATVKRWWRYAKVLEHLLPRLDLEKVKFANACEELLYEIAGTKELRLLLEDPGGPQWASDTLLDGLREHLGRSFKACMAAVTDMRTMLERLIEKLELDNNGQPRWVDRKIYKREWKRVRLSLTHAENEELLKNIGNNNRDISELLGHRRRMSGLSTLRSFKDVGKFKSIRANATSLHNALFNNFTHHCECSMSHIANLRLESRDGISNITVDGTDGETRDLSFDVLFAFTATSTDGSPGLAWPWRETAIQSINGAFYNDEPESGIGLPLNLCAPPVASVTSKSVPAPGSSQSYRHDSGAANVRNGHTSKIKKVSFQGPAPSPSESGTLPLVPTLATGRRTQAAQIDEKVKSLCMLLRQVSDTPAFLGVLDDGPHRQHRVKLVKECVQSSLSVMVSLDVLLRRQTRLERKAKLVLAVKLASTLLQLQYTPWLKKVWRSGDILFLERQKDAESRLLESVFVSTSFDQVSHPQPSEAPWGPAVTFPVNIRNESVFCLGIVLIELWYGQPLRCLYAPIDDPSPEPEQGKIADFIIAKSLLENVYRDAGDWYGDAVRRCIYCEFDLRDSSLETDKMIDAVHRGVYLPLLEHLRAFCGGSLDGVVY